MSDDNIDVKERYDKFVFNLSQFVSEPIKDFPSIKSEILNILKTHRPVRVVDYQNGLSNSLKQKTQLIIHECSERAKVREYFKVGRTNVWKCCECHRTNSSSNNDSTELILAHGIVFIKIGHDCMPRQLLFVQQIQKLYKEKNIDGAVALQKSVLGSEDLNISVNKTRAAGKRGTKSSKVMVPESTLQYFLELGLNIQELKSLNMDEPAEDIQEKLSPEDSFANIVENLEKYSTEKKEAILSNKSKLLSCLKTHYPVKISNYEFGLSENLRPNRHLIVFEWNDRKRVRDYSQKSSRNNQWICRECFRINDRVSNRGVVNSYPFLYFVSGIVFVPNEHSCKPMNYLLIMHYQKLLQEGNVTGAKRMKIKINFIYGECDFSNIVNVLDETMSVSLPENRKEFNENNS